MLAKKTSIVKSCNVNNLLSKENITSKLFQAFLITTLFGSFTMDCTYQNQKWGFEMSYKAALRQLVEQIK